MKGRDHTIAQMTVDPWIITLAVLIGLAILFFMCTTRVQANAPGIFDPSMKDTETLPARQTPDNNLKSQAWYIDFSDISNERAGHASEAHPSNLSGSIKEDKRTPQNRMIDWFNPTLWYKPQPSSAH